MLCALSALEGADTQLLGASMMALQQSDLSLSLTEISYMAMAQLVCTNVAAPFWGIVADRGVLQRRHLLVVGAMGQGIVTILLALVSSIWPMILLRAVNGVLLAALRPISNGIVADLTGAGRRGKIFGRVQAAWLLGMFLTILVVVPMASQEIAGFQGWRVAFVLLGTMAVGVSAAVAVFMAEPPRCQHECAKAGGCAVLAHEAKNLLSFFKIPSFCVLLVQGVFGTIPWSVMGYMTLFFQLAGIPDEQAAVLSSMAPVAGAAGNIVGGLVSDFLAFKYLLHGRPMSAQITVACGIPLIYMIFWGVPPGQGSFGVYFALNVAFGLLGSWAQSGTNFPILAHIVPASSRSRVMAWECALENSLAAAIGPMVVSLLAEQCFGYSFETRGEDQDPDVPAARALGKAMAATICIPWLFCFVAYALLHWSYPRDVLRLEDAAQGPEVDRTDSCESGDARA